MPSTKSSSEEGMHFALSFTFPKLLTIVKNSYDRCQNGSSSDAIVAVVFAVACLESFISDLVALSRFTHRPERKMFGTFISTLEELEESRTQVTRKYQITKIIFTGKGFDKGCQPFQDLSLLIKIRNQLIHPVPDEFRTDEEGNPIDMNRNHKLITTLAKRDLCKEPGKFSKDWTTYFENDQRLAKWACLTAVAMIREIFEVFPKNSMAWMMLQSELQKSDVI